MKRLALLLVLSTGCPAQTLVIKREPACDTNCTNSDGEGSAEGQNAETEGADTVDDGTGDTACESACDSTT